jgi:hypothetical protein
MRGRLALLKMSFGKGSAGAGLEVGFETSGFGEVTERRVVSQLSRTALGCVRGAACVVFFHTSFERVDQTGISFARMRDRLDLVDVVHRGGGDGGLGDRDGREVGTR